MWSVFPPALGLWTVWVQRASWNWALLWILFLMIFLGTLLERQVSFTASQAFWIKLGFPSGLVGKESACYTGDLASIPGSGNYRGEGNGNPLQYSCLENPMDRRAWWATVHGVTRVGHNWVIRPPSPHVAQSRSQSSSVSEAGRVTSLDGSRCKVSLQRDMDKRQSGEW